jgi:hypothetical protein
MKRMRVLRARRRVLLLALAFALAACVGDPSPTPQPTSTTAAAARTATPTKTPTPTPTPRPTRTPRPSRPPATLPPAADPWPVPGSDPAATAAVVKAIDELRTLPAYRFEASVVGRSVLKIDTDNLLDTGARGWLTHTPETSVEGDFGTRMVESAFDGAVSSAEHYVIVDGVAWTVRSGASPEPTAVPDAMLEYLALWLPEGVAERTILPFAEGFERVGNEQHEGVATVHYRLTPGGADAYTNVTGVSGTWTGDLWMAVDGGYLVAATIDGTPPPRPSPSVTPSGLTSTWSKDRGLHVIISISDANDPTIVVKPPA